MLRIESFLRDLRIMREKKPMIHHIMNFVIMNDAANITLSIGAAPIMAHAVEELEDLASVADAIYINIGTLDSPWIESMIKLSKLAEKYNKPLLLDPVGVGATKLRTETAIKILETGAVSVLKGNAGEMLALAGLSGKVRGVESLVESGFEAVEILAKRYNTVAVATGKIDYVSRGDSIFGVEGGSEMFKYVSGAGCMLGSVIASFMAVNRDFVEASLEGSLAFKRAGEIAEIKSGRNPGTFKVELFNSIFNIQQYVSEDIIRERVRLIK
ncbi:MAG: hydroxyethylthiazole kinase [Sulfolobales archaeon]